MKKSAVVMMIAGEASGDHHGAMVVAQLRRLNRHLRFCGIGGPAMAKAGVHLVMDAADMAVVGITEVFAKLPQLRRGRRLARELLARFKPDLLILIDFPEFNLNTAAYAKKLGVPVLYYISPQIWAWRQRRVKKIKRRVDHMAVILPFEEDFYRQHGVPVTFVGHPLLDQDRPESLVHDDVHNRRALTIGLLPGSRHHEVSMLLPDMVAATLKLIKTHPQSRFIISQAPTVTKAHLQSVLEGCILPPHCDIDASDIRDVLGRCDLVVAASGTVALDTALSHTPFVVVYRVSPLSAWLGRRLIRVKYICLVNLIAGRKVVPELIQADVTAANIAREIHGILADPNGLGRFKSELRAVCQKLGRPGAAARVASIAMEIIQKKGPSVANEP